MGVWASREFDNHEQVCIFSDAETGLRAIAAIHSTALGPAVGGTRFKPYADEQEALDDALRLSRAMSYKSALAGLPVGGGKAVIMGDPARIKSRALLHAYGRFIDRIGATFATGEDVGMGLVDIETVNEVTTYVGGTTASSGDPSVFTSAGVIHGMRAVLEWQFDRSDFEGVRVAVQGLGAVGWAVAKRLHDEGAVLTVADTRGELVARAAAEFGAATSDPGAIHAVDVDIYAPCALGGVIHAGSVPQIRARAVAGAANNQLASAAAGEALAARGILFAPDFVLNAGGIIGGMSTGPQIPGRHVPRDRPVEQKLEAIHGRLLQIFDRAARDNQTPEASAERLAREIIAAKSLDSSSRAGTPRDLNSERNLITNEGR